MQKLVGYYLRVMASIGRWISVSKPANNSDDSLRPVHEGAEINPDKIASSLGNKFRSLGVLIGIFGILLMLFAIMPIGLGLDQATSSFLNYARLLLMMVILGIHHAVSAEISLTIRENTIRRKQ